MWNKKNRTEEILQEAASIAGSTHQLLEGNLEIGIDTKAYKVLKELSRDIDQIGRNFHGYIKEISHVLAHLSAGNIAVSLSQEVVYRGDFLPIKNALRKIRHSLHSSLKEINQLSGQLDQFCGQVEKGAVQIAENTTNQAELINELTEKIYEITNQTSKNADDAEMASDNVLSVQKEALVGRDYMDQMLTSIQQVKLSSNDISHVIDIISGLAGQTKLLALNASIEAARAGEAGAGFSVVAKEIGDLAQKSADAVKRTTQLIDNSINSAEVSAGTVEKAAKSFITIQKSIDYAAVLCSGIAKASSNQAKGLKDTSEIITNISMAVQNNAAYAQENSALATDMAEASAHLKKLMSRFQLEENKGEGPEVKNGYNIEEEQEIGAFMEELKGYCEAKGMDSLLQRLLQRKTNYECLYVISQDGYQISHTIMNPDIIIEEEEGFQPAMPGDYYGTKKYFIQALQKMGRWYQSEEYISAATGGLCRTYSCSYQGTDKKTYVLCVDVISRF